MKSRSKRVLLGAALLCAPGLLGHPEAQAPAAPPAPTKTVRPVANFVPVTDQTIRAPKPEDWLIHRGNYQAWGYSPLDKITKANVKTLQLVWSRAMEPGINQATPLIYNGVMYLGNPGDVIQAVDAASGDLMWEYRHPMPPAASFRSNHGQRKRSIALYGEHIYTVTWDNTVVALEARTGKLAWQTNRGGDFFVSNSMGPIVANGVVVAGSTCQVAGHGCYVTGSRCQDRQGTLAQCDDSAPGRARGRDVGRLAVREPVDDRRLGSAHLRSRPRSRLLRINRRRPASEAQRKMPGATMAGTNTRFAVRSKTGEVVWRHQVLPRDNWDQECTFEMMIINTPVNPEPAGMLAVNPDARRGPRKTLTGIPCKTGIAWSFDAATGEFLWARPTTEQNLVARIDHKGLVTVNEDVVLKEIGKTYHVCPTYGGGRDWPQGAYNPRSNVMYMPLTNLCIESTARTRSRSGPVVRLQHDECRQVGDRQGQGRPHRRDLGRDRQDPVELGDAGRELLADPGDRRRAAVQRLDGPLPARARCRQREGPVADAARRAGGRRHRDVFGQRPPVHCDHGGRRPDRGARRWA